jgi:hypothetical protein
MHWEIPKHLCQVTRVKGNLIPHSCLAAPAIESGSEWLSKGTPNRPICFQS